MDTATAENLHFLLTFDVEDWFQVENFKSCIPFSSWKNCELRVEKNVNTILDLMDSFDFAPKATFFILGWIAERLPDMVRQIHQRGHEVASHGYGHELPTKLAPHALMEDLCSSKKLLEDMIGQEVTGYRAPSFAADNRILNLVGQAQYRYDASYNSFAAHGRYGKMDLSSAEKKEGYYIVSRDFFEIPVTNLHLGNTVIPLGGGGYFRLIPFPIFRQAVKQAMKQDKTFMFYAHPWEIDPDQPRVNHVPWKLKFRHYVNLDKTEKKLEKLIQSFSHCRFLSCRQLLSIP